MNVFNLPAGPYAKRASVTTWQTWPTSISGRQTSNAASTRRL